MGDDRCEMTDGRIVPTHEGIGGVAGDGAGVVSAQLGVLVKQGVVQPPVGGDELSARLVGQPGLDESAQDGGHHTCVISTGRR